MFTKSSYILTTNTDQPGANRINIYLEQQVIFTFISTLLLLLEVMLPTSNSYKDVAPSLPNNIVDMWGEWILLNSSHIEVCDKTKQLHLKIIIKS